VSEIAGSTLRLLRQRAGVGLERVAKRARVSASHLGRVEREVPQRPVTPAIVAAYEAVLGVRLSGADVAAGAVERGGALDPVRRQAFNASIAMVSVGGPLGEPLDRLLDVRTPVPSRVGLADMAELEEAARLVTQLDLRFGGSLAGLMAHSLLRWAVGLQRSSVSAAAGGRLQAVIGCLADRAGWAAFDTDHHDSARQLFKVALEAAVAAGDADLRAHILADIAAQHNALGEPDDCLQIVRFADGDERVSPAVRLVLHGVKARAYAAGGEAGGCARQIDLTEQAGEGVEQAAVPGWMGRFQSAHVYAMTGHAAAALALSTGADADRVEAERRLVRAVDGLDPSARARAVALCLTALAAVHLRGGDGQQAAHWTRRALRAAEPVRSARVRHGLTALRTAAAARADEPPIRELVEDLDAGMADA
jgi:transcriptional regulator with XRE-family HTH domain